jgi:hypothetical protein
MLKKFLIGTLVAVALMATSASAATDFGTSTVKKGSPAVYVKAVQTLVGATPVDGLFGPMTMQKVKDWQTANGLTPDGLFGKASMAKANGGAVVVTPNTPSTPSTPSTLEGAEGSITSVDNSTSGTETTLGEGKDEKVLGMKVTADDGSDLAINTMKVVINTFNDGVDNLGSTRLERHIDGVEVYMGTTKVGSADVADFTKSSTSTYTKSVSLSNAVVKAGEYAKFYVVVNAKSVIDSENIDNSWDLSVSSIRYTDAMGVVSTTTDIAADAVTFDFESTTANDDITSLTASSNPDATTLKVKDTGTSDEYMAFSFKLKAATDSSDLNVLMIPITATTSSAGADAVISDIYLKVGSTVYDNYELVTGDIYEFTIDAGDLTIDAGQTAEVKVYATFNKEGLVSTYDSNETVKFSLVGTNVDVENIDGDTVSSTNISPKAGNIMTLSTSSTLISSVTTDSTIDTDGKVATYTFKFTVEADGADVTLSDSTIVETVSQTATHSFSIKKDSGTAEGTLGTSYVVADGENASFTVTYTVDPIAPKTTGTYYVTIDTIAGVSVDKTAGPETITTL